MEQPILCPVVAVTELPACFFCFREIQEDSAKRFPIKGGLVTVVNPPRGEYYGLVRDTNDRLSDCYWTSMCELHTSQYGELRAVVRLEAGPSYRGPSGYFEQERDLEEEQEGDPERGGEGEEIHAPRCSHFLAPVRFCGIIILSTSSPVSCAARRAQTTGGHPKYRGGYAMTA